MAKRSFGNWTPIKTIRSHTGVARFLAELDGEAEIAAYIPRIEEIPSPYAYAPTWPVYLQGGRHVFFRETSHKVYDVFEVPAGTALVDADGEAVS